MTLSLARQNGFSIPGQADHALSSGVDRSDAGSPDRTAAPLLDEIQQRAAAFFWQEADPQTGLIKDRADNFGSDAYCVCNVAGVGFGLAALAVGADRGWLSRSEAYARTLTTLRFLLDRMPHRQGFFYHFVNWRTGRRVWRSEASSIDTAWLLAGALFAGEYYPDSEVSQIADQLYRRVDFVWMLHGGRLGRSGAGQEELLSHGWTPEKGFLPYCWDSYNELMILYLLAIGSPTHPIPASCWAAWARPEGSYAGYRTFAIGPLFTHQYSQAWVDFSSRRDRLGCDYFESSVAATLANRRFCLDHSHTYRTYADDVWGLTASDGPHGYRAYGAPPGRAEHDGTVAPAAAAGSIVFTPELSCAALATMHARFGDRIWGRYGFSDAFNVDRDWWGRDVIGIDLGITLLMIENYRSGLIWRTFERNAAIRAALAAVGFTSVASSTASAAALRTPELTARYSPWPGLQADTAPDLG